jgi:hypothetical protein
MHFHYEIFPPKQSTKRNTIKVCKADGRTFVENDCLVGQTSGFCKTTMRLPIQRFQYSNFWPIIDTTVGMSTALARFNPMSIFIFVKLKISFRVLHF